MWLIESQGNKGFCIQKTRGTGFAMCFSVQSIYKTKVLQANMRSPWSKSFSYKLATKLIRGLAKNLRLPPCKLIHV